MANSKSDTSEGYRWTKPKSATKNTFPPTWELIQTGNHFEPLFESNELQEQQGKQTNLQEDMTLLLQSNNASVDIQHENVRLQRQVQYLQSRIPKSAPTNNLPDKCNTLQNRAESKDQNNKKPKLDTKQSVTIFGDSMKYQDERLHTKKKRIVQVRSYAGARSEDLIDHCKPVARRGSDVISLHARTNDLNERDKNCIIENIKKINNETVHISPKTKVLISLIITRFDGDYINDKGVLVNDKLMQEFPKNNIIDNSNFDRQCFGIKGLHLAD